MLMLVVCGITISVCGRLPATVASRLDIMDRKC
jgi:hypothetical protein